MKIIEHTKHIKEIKSFWSPKQCDDLIKLGENTGFEAAKVETEQGHQVVEHIRNNKRVLFKDSELAHDLWQRSSEFVLKKLGNSKAVGLNELFRLYRYEPGEQFRKHRDQSIIIDEHLASYFTFMIYLNDDFEGGATRFSDISIKPRQGSCLIFFHDLEHEGAKLSNGRKYVLRTDIMYRLEI